MAIYPLEKCKRLYKLGVIFKVNSNSFFTHKIKTGFVIKPSVMDNEIILIYGVKTYTLYNIKTGFVEILPKEFKTIEEYKSYYREKKLKRILNVS